MQAEASGVRRVEPLAARDGRPHPAQRSYRFRILPLLLAGIASCAAPGVEVLSRRAGTSELLVSVWFVDARTGFAVGGDREDSAAALVRTRDGGATWEAYVTGVRARLYAVHFPTPRVGYAVGLHGALLRTADGGERWSRIDAGSDGWLAGVFFTSAEVGHVVGGGDTRGLLLRTRDGGATWRSRMDAVPEACRSAALRDVFFVDDARGYVVGERGVILRTRDGGDSWELCASGVDAWLRAVCFLDARRGFVAGAGGVLLATADGGDSWRRLDVGTADKLNDLLFVDASVGYVVTMEGRLFRTADGGATWIRVHEEHGALTALNRASDGVTYAVGDDGVLLEIREG